MTTLFGDISERPLGLQAVPNRPHNRTETSKAAAARQTENKVEHDYRLIREAMLNRGPMGYTREELSAVTGILPNSINPRTKYLIDTGDLVPKRDAEGKRVKRKTQSGGSPAQVLIHTRHATNQEIARP